jgi:hypothetical protein
MASVRQATVDGIYFVISRRVCFFRKDERLAITGCNGVRVLFKGVTVLAWMPRFQSWLLIRCGEIPAALSRSMTGSAFFTPRLYFASHVSAG